MNTLSKEEGTENEQEKSIVIFDLNKNLSFKS